MNQEDCLICRETYEIDDYVKLKCGHMYCVECFRTWYKKKTTTSCCLCFKEFEITDYIELDYSEMSTPLLTQKIENAIKQLDKETLKKIVDQAESEYPMILASKSQNLELLRFLNSIGAKASYRARYEAIINQDKEIILFLESIGITGENRGSLDVIAHLISLGRSQPTSA